MDETLKIIMDKLNGMDSDIKELKKLSGIELDIKDLRKHVVVIENDHGAKLDALMDGYTQLHEGQQEIKKDIKDIKDTLNVHEIRLSKVK